MITDHWAATCRCFSVRVDAVLLCITYIPHIPLLGFAVKVIFQLILVLFDMDLANPGKYDSLCYCFFIILYIGVGEFGVRGVTGEALSICSHNLLSSVGSQWFHILTTKQRTCISSVTYFFYASKPSIIQSLSVNWNHPSTGFKTSRQSTAVEN